jgi:hypothetical protein
MGIEGGVERTIANSNAVALLSFAKSLVGFKHVEGIVTRVFNQEWCANPT